MRTKDLFLRCYAIHKDGCWQAFCLDLSLAAQADTLEDAKAKLAEMTQEYVYDALAGEDKDYSDQLLNRKAPADEWLKYYFLWTKTHLLHLSSKLQCIFDEIIPLRPVSTRA